MNGHPEPQQLNRSKLSHGQRELSRNWIFPEIQNYVPMSVAIEYRIAVLKLDTTAEIEPKFASKHKVRDQSDATQGAYDTARMNSTCPD